MKVKHLSPLFISILMMTSLWVIGQPPGGPGGPGGRNMAPEDRAQMMTDRMTEALELDEAQTEMIYAINLESAMQMAEARESSNGDREAMRETMMKLRKDTNDRIKEVLTPTQLTQYDEMLKNRRQGRQGRQGPPGEGGKKRKGKKKADDTDSNS